MALTSDDAATLVAARSARLLWHTVYAGLALAALALVALFSREAVGAVQVWLDSAAYNHCFLIIPVAVYLAWRKRGALAGLAPEPIFWPLALLIPLVMLWLVAALLSILEVQQLIILAMFQVMALAIVGWPVYRAMLMPFLYLFFLVPFGYFLVPSLQDFTAWFTVAALKLSGIPVFSDGTLIEIPAGSFVIAEACAGIRFLIASVAFGVLFASLMFRSRLRWTIFIALSIVVPIIANGLRAFGILALAEITSNTTAVMADHVIYGWGFFTFVTFVLIGIGMSFADADGDEELAASAAESDIGGVRPAHVGAVAAVAILLAALGPGYALARDWQGGTLRLAAAAPVGLAASWHKADPGEVPWRATVIDPDREFHDVFSDGRSPVLRYIALYATGGLHNNLVRGQNVLTDGRNWALAGSGTAAVSIHGAPATVATTTVVRGEQRLMLWHFYVVDGRIAATPMAAKLAQLRGLVHAGTSVAAFVVVATPIINENAAAADQTLTHFLNDMAPLGPYLGRLATN